MNVMIDTNVILDDILSRGTNTEAARKIIRNLLLSFMVASVDGEDCQVALDLPMGDFEDALVVVCAEKANLNYIVTNDKGFLSSTELSVPPISPTDFILKFRV